MRWWSVVCTLGVMLSGCGRLAFDEAVDAGPDTPLGPFGAPQVIGELSTPSADDDPALPGDELEIYWDTDRPGGMGSEDIWRATRPDIGSPWSTPQPVVELNTAMGELSPGITLDGLTIIIARSGGGGTGLDLWQSTRPDRGSAWSAPVRIDELSDFGEDTNAQVSADGLTIWFNSKRNSAGVRQMWSATRSATAAPWNAPVAVDALNVVGNTNIYTGDASPTADDKQLYFITDRLGTKNIWIVDRPTPTTYATLRPVPELASPNVQTDPWISVDQHRLYFAEHVGGSAELVVVTR